MTHQLDQQIDRIWASVNEMSAAIRDLQKMRDEKEIEVMNLQRKRDEERKNNG